jgi:hypothetical protein
MDGDVAVMTDHQRFPPPGAHNPFPDREFPLAWTFQVRQFPDVVTLDPIA